MEINNIINKDEILEFPDNYEEIANLALLNFEKTRKLDLNQLIKKGTEKNKKFINENKKLEEKESKNDEWKDFESDEGEKNLNIKYQKFEDEDCFEKEDVLNKITEIKPENIVEYVKYDKMIKEKKKIIENKEYIIEKNNNNEKKIINNQQESSNENNRLKKQRLSDEQIKKMISKINYVPPDWARNLNDQEFIHKLKLHKKIYTKNI